MGCVALFCALSGAAYAVARAPANSVVTKSIKNGAVTTKKIHKGAVTTSKFAGDAQVPNAVHVITADELGGLDPSAYQRRVSGACNTHDWGMAFINSVGEAGCFEGPVESLVLTPSAGADGTRFVADSNLFFTVLCHESGKTELAFTNNSGGGATLNWIYSDGTTVHASGNSLANQGTQEFSFAGKRIEGQFIFAWDSQNGRGVTTFVVHAFDGTSFCEVRGNDYVAPA